MPRRGDLPGAERVDLDVLRLAQRDARPRAGTWPTPTCWTRSSTSTAPPAAPTECGGRTPSSPWAGSSSGALTTEPPGQPKADDEGEEAEDVVRHRVPGLRCVQAEPFVEPESGRHKPVDKDAWVLHPRYCAARANGQGDHSSAPPGTAAATSSDLTRASGAEVVGSFGGPPHPAFAPSAPPATRPARGGSGEITTYLVLGVDLQLVGGLLLVSGLVAGVASSFDTGESDSGLGTVFVLLLEWAATIAGTFCLLVGVIAKCVQIGNRAT